MAKTKIKASSPIAHSSSGKSKGKWMPGTMERNQDNPSVTATDQDRLYCQCCDRKFLTESSLEKHLSTEYHFTRERKKEAAKVSTLWFKPGIAAVKPPFQFDILADGEVMPNQRSRRSGLMNKLGTAEGNTDRIQCPTCFSSFNKNMMGKHLLSFFHCQNTGAMGTREEPEQSLILNNISSIVALAPYQCKPCRFYFNRHDQLVKHFENIHAKNSKKLSPMNPWAWNCSACQSHGVDASDMLRHLTRSEQHKKMQATIQMSIPIVLKTIRLFICSACKKKFTLQRALTSHQKLWHPNMMEAKERLRNSNTNSVPEVSNEIPETPALVVCEVCSKSFKNRAALASHIRAQHEGRPLRFCCSHCGYSTNHKSHYKRHAKIHDVIRPKNMKCGICDASFYEKYQLTFHMKLHEGKSVRCSYTGCDFIARTQSEISAHAVKHDDVMRFQCTQCDYKSCSNPNMKRHIMLVHTESNKYFTCSKCDFKSKTAYELKRHSISHSGQRQYLCPFCPYAARTIENLRTHVVWRTMHKGQKLYNCSLCTEKGFRTNTLAEFKSHVVKEHSVMGTASNITDLELYVYAKIRKPETATNDNFNHDATEDELKSFSDANPLLPVCPVNEPDDALLDMPVPVQTSAVSKNEDSEIASILKNLIQEEVFDKLGSSVIMNPVEYL